jgi:hypothetical protein
MLDVEGRLTIIERALTSQRIAMSKRICHIEKGFDRGNHRFPVNNSEHMDEKNKYG